MGKESPKVSVVVGKDDEAEDKWLVGNELEAYIKNNPKKSFSEVAQRVKDIFGIENMRGYARGIPNVFLKGEHAHRDSVVELLKWNN